MTHDDAQRLVWERVFHLRAADRAAETLSTLPDWCGLPTFLVHERDGGIRVVSVGPRGGLSWRVVLSGEEYEAITEAVNLARCLG